MCKKKCSIITNFTNYAIANKINLCIESKFCQPARAEPTDVASGGLSDWCRDEIVMTVRSIYFYVTLTLGLGEFLRRHKLNLNCRIFSPWTSNPFSF